MFELDNKLFNDYRYIAGVDEVGRGPLFGDVYAVAIIMPKSSCIDGIKDSKKLSENKREILYDKIVVEALDIGVGTANVEEINLLNIKEATCLAMKRAIKSLKIIPDLILVDYEELSEYNTMSIIKGDSLSYNIACASIVAKVLRDRKCIEWDIEYPGYYIKDNKGYGTKIHREQIIKLGPTPLHREKFIRKLVR